MIMDNDEFHVREEQEQITPDNEPTPSGWRAWLPGAALILILAFAAYLRFVGLNWDAHTHLHPDERFLTLVQSSLQIPGSISEYFDTQNSLLNPYNVGHKFFVYGTFPIFLVRFIGEAVKQTGYDEIHLVGRAVSASFDLVSIVIVYFIGRRLYDKRVGLLAAVFTSFTVLLIQHAHFFVVDPVANTFILAGFYFAVRVLDENRPGDYALFGLALGLAVASKISAAPLAGTVALAAGLHLFKYDTEQREQVFKRVVVFLLLAAAVSLIAFRVFQPYAFKGPSFFNISLNPDWLSNMAEIREQQKGNTDAPYALQWADRQPVWFSFKNMVLWGFGLPLGLLAWGSYLWALIQCVRGRWQRHLLPVVWTGGFFLWQSIGFTMAMRYQLPIYPLLSVFAGWGLVEAWRSFDHKNGILRRWGRIGVATLGAIVVLATAFYAFAFHAIYRTPFTRAAASRWIYQNIPGSVNLVVKTDAGEKLEVLAMPQEFVLFPEAKHIVEVHTDLNGSLEGVWIPFISTDGEEPEPISLRVSLTSEPDSGNEYAARLVARESQSSDEFEIRTTLEQPVQINSDTRLFLNIENLGKSAVRMRGTRLVHETTWDDGLPWGIDGRNLNGRYEVSNLELYWHDDQDDDQNGVPDKLERIAESLDESEYLLISSNRQYGTITRVPIRYPLTIAYYRALFGCPEPLTVLECGAKAEVNELESLLGYDLVKVFESHPRIGSIRINDQLAEEAFTVYDHPKVLIFKKSEDFSKQVVYDLLGDVDVSNVQHVIPRDVNSQPEREISLLLPEELWTRQTQGGTWSELFNTDRLINRYPGLAVIFWWLTFTSIGIVFFPITYLIFNRFADKGYAVSRLLGLLLFGWLSWMLGSLGVSITRLTLLLVLVVFAAGSTAIAYWKRSEFADFFRTQWRELLWIEAFALIFFLVDLGIRYGNPDLWHPAKGGEKPMDFSYLNAVIKSTVYPPYDPWYAGGYINYYYYGFILVGLPIKVIGLMPAVAYNLVIPTLFSLLGLAAYSVGYHLLALWKQKFGPEANRNTYRIAGVTAALLIVVLGNLGTARMFYDGFKRIGTPSGEAQGELLVGAAHAARGFFRYLTFQETDLYPIDQWYWNPSRAITPGEGEAGPITEFPFFTFLYADLHAHMISRPVTILALAWVLALLSEVTKSESRQHWRFALLLFTGALILGALRPTNTWDFPVYWAIGALAAFYATWQYFGRMDVRTVLIGAAAAGLLLALAQVLYQPYHSWYGQGYQRAELWEGSLTPLLDYITVHGVFLFMIVSWMLYETIGWMAKTPISALAGLRDYMGLIATMLVIVVGVTALLFGMGYRIALIVFPLLLWTAVLLLRSGLHHGKRIVLMLFGIGLMLTFVVEFVVLVGDISRMNTVFKFYLQVWELFGLAAAAAFAWSWSASYQWEPLWRRAWFAISMLLLFSAALYPLTAATAKIRDRMVQIAPASLNGMDFMRYADHYFELNAQLDLAQDYEAIRWLQENVEGSPVIIEANVPEYRWGSRYTIYTGLPGVLGWRWHQSQQRVAANGDSVNERLYDITDFYLTSDLSKTKAILDKYAVQYVMVGQLERTYYEYVEPCFPLSEEGGITCNLRGYPMGMPSNYETPVSACKPLNADDENAGLRCPTRGLEKFSILADQGSLKTVFETGETVIYEVMD
jgi:YYY domain-containing protein